MNRLGFSKAACQSPRTANKLTERKKTALKGRSGTKPGTLLKHQIPVRNFADWDEMKPGFMEMDLVAHDGGSSHGEYCQILDVTDVCTGRSEQFAVPTKVQGWVFEAIQEMRHRLYAVVRDYVNFFMPSMKPIEKVRDGARVRKRYGKAQTPYQRLLVLTRWERKA